MAILQQDIQGMVTWDIKNNDKKKFIVKALAK